jgi:L-threonylcarbamoyladenylate synthase
MNTEIIKINDPDKQTDAIARAAALLRAGDLVVIPTETVYGLGGDGTNPLSAQKIYEAKGRPSDNPLIIHVAYPEDAEKYAVTNPLYYKLASAFMPGPLTVILPKKENVPYETTGGLDTVAIRCPAHPVAHAIIKEAGVPVAAPSANISGRPSATSVKYVIEDFDGRVDMIVDGGDCEIGLESTIVLITKESGLILLRPGAITYDALCCVCDNVTVSPTLEGTLKEDEHPLSPGMKYRHYAPASQFVLLDGEDDKIIEFLKKEQEKCRCAILCYDEEAELLYNSLLLPIGRRGDLKTHAKMLFARLRECDSLSPDVIYAHIPDKEGLGLALYNRMIRAAAHTVLKIEN